MIDIINIANLLHVENLTSHARIDCFIDVMTH